MAESLQKLALDLSDRNGPGWIITLVEHMRAEWHCTLHEAIFRESLTAAAVLWPATLTRHGVEVHGTSVDKARQKAKERKRREIREHYEVVKTPAKDRLAMLRGMRNARGAG